MVMEDGKNNEMTGDSPSVNKSQPNVVDDFLAALFASHPPNIPVTTESDESPSEGAQRNRPTTSNDNGSSAPLQDAVRAKRDRTPDEFDEYEMLSKRKHASGSQMQGTGPSSQNFNKGSWSAGGNGVGATQRQMNQAPKHNMSRKYNMSHPAQQGNKAVPEARLVVKHMPNHVKKRELVARFSRYGHVVDCHLKKNFGYIQFDNPASCRSAVQAENGKPFNGFRLELEICHWLPSADREAELRMANAPRGPPPAPNYSSNAVQPNALGRPVNYRDGPRDRSTNFAGARNWNEGHHQEPLPNGKDDPRQFHSKGPSGIHLQGNANHFRNESPSFERTNQPFVPARDHHMGYAGTRQGPSMSDAQNERGFYQNIAGNSYQDGGRMPPSGSGRGFHKGKRGGRAPHVQGRGMEFPQRHVDPVEYGKRDVDFPIPYRTGNDIPLVQVVAWGNVNRVFTDHIEKTFKSRMIHIHTLFLRYGQVARDDLLKHFITEGVKALIIIDQGKDVQGKVYLQVFEKNEGAGEGSFRYDEYASITVEEAVAVIERAHPKPPPTMAYSSSNNNNNNSQTHIPPQQSVNYGNFGQPTMHMAPQPTMQSATPPSTQPAPLVSALSAVDPNTISHLLKLVQGLVDQEKQNSTFVGQSATTQPSAQPQLQQQSHSFQPSVSVVSSPAPNMASTLSAQALQGILASMNQATSGGSSSGSNGPPAMYQTQSPSQPPSQPVYGGGYNKQTQSLPGYQGGKIQDGSLNSFQQPSTYYQPQQQTSTIPSHGGSTPTAQNQLPSHSTFTSSAPSVNVGNISINEILDKIQFLTQQAPVSQHQ